MGLPNEVNSALIGAAAAAAGTYEIEQSLRFDGAAELYWTPSSAGNRDTWTWSAWIKLSKPHDGTNQCIFSAISGSGGSDSTQLSINFPGTYAGTGADTLTCGLYSQTAKTTNARYRDYSAWYNVVVVRERGAATTTDGMRFYINNERVDIDAYDHLLTAVTAVNNNITHRIGEFGNYNRHFHGYMAEVHFLDGTAVTDAEDFGEYDNNGVWRPIAYSGSYGTNGFYLKFDPSATNGIGHDHSGNGNNWTASGFTTSGTGTDVMSDTPTNNFATLNPVDWSYTSGASLGNGALYFTNSSTTAYSTVRTGFRVPASGKYYFEFTLGVASNHTTNVGLTDGNNNSWNWAHGSNTSQTKYNGTDQSTEGSSSNGVVCAYAINNGQIRLYRGNSLIHTWSQSASGYVRAFVSGSWSNSVTFNFGQRAFTYTPPADHLGWATANLPAPEIADGSDYFQTVLYQGNDPTGQNITVADNSNNTWQPDLVWIKARGVTYWHRVYDAVRGATKELYMNDTSSEDTDSNALTSFNSDGFTLGSDQGVNQNTYNFVSWNWLAGNGTSSNTAGSITSTVSANPSAGFSIVSYTGNNTSGATVGHGLGVAPDLIIVKNRDNSAANWTVYHSANGSSPETQRLKLNATSGTATVGYWNNTAPSSTVFTLSSGSGVNETQNLIAYCFAEVEGYSKFGSYTSSNGYPFVWTGFSPKFLIIKNYASSIYGWFMWDDKRETYNPHDAHFQTNSANAESSNAVYDVDMLSNGFKIRGSSAAINNGSFVYMAFAGHPFGGDGVSPATAR